MVLTEVLGKKMKFQPAVFLGAILWPIVALPVIGAFGLPLAVDLLLLLAFVFVIASKRSLGVAYANLTVLVCVFLLLIELPSRIVIQTTPYYRPQDLYAEVPLLQREGHQRRYIPNVNIAFKVPHGDLVAIGGRGVFEARQGLIRSAELIFQTDEYGYRNAKGSASGADLVLIGDSFIDGAGLDQSDTPAQQINSLTGKNAYAVAFPDDPEGYGRRLTEAYSWLNPDLPKVLFLFAGNDFIFQKVDKGIAQQGGEFSIHSLLVKQLRAKGAYTRLLYQRLHLKSPSVLNNIFASALDGYSKANLHNSDVVIARSEAVSHDFALYRPYLESAEQTDPKAISVRMGLTRQQLATTKCVVLIPSKEQLFLTLENKHPNDSPMLNVVDQQISSLTKARIVDLLPIFVNESRRNPDKALYLPDDTHWSPHAVKLTAHVLSAKACL